MHTPIEFYATFPCALFRGGAPNKPKFDYLRTSPPRDDTQIYDVKLQPDTGLIDHNSGGLSMFNAPNFKFTQDWWVIKADTQLPPGFTLTKDLTDGTFNGHYSIRAMADIRVDDWKTVLREWAETHAVPYAIYQQQEARRVQSV